MFIALATCKVTCISLNQINLYLILKYSVCRRNWLIGPGLESELQTRPQRTKPLENSQPLWWYQNKFYNGINSAQDIISEWTVLRKDDILDWFQSKSHNAFLHNCQFPLLFQVLVIFAAYSHNADYFFARESTLQVYVGTYFVWGYTIVLLIVLIS